MGVMLDVQKAICSFIKGLAVLLKCNYKRTLLPNVYK